LKEEKYTPLTTIKSKNKIKRKKKILEDEEQLQLLKELKSNAHKIT